MALERFQRDRVKQRDINRLLMLASSRHFGESHDSMILNLEMKLNLVLSFCCRDLARDLSLSDSEDEENKVTYPFSLLTYY